MRRIRTFKIATLLLLVFVLVAAPTVCASDNNSTNDNPDNTSSVNIRVNVHSDMESDTEATVAMESTGKIDAQFRLTVDGVPVEKRFDSLKSAMSEIARRGLMNEKKVGDLRRGFSRMLDSSKEFRKNVQRVTSVNRKGIQAVMNRTENNRELYRNLSRNLGSLRNGLNYLEGAAENNRALIMANENRIRWTIGSTKYNREQRRALENRFSIFLREDFAALQSSTGHNRTLIKYNDNRIEKVFTNTRRNRGWIREAVYRAQKNRGLYRNLKRNLGFLENGLNYLGQVAENNRALIMANENRISMVLQNTKYNKRQHEILKDHYGRFRSENFASLKAEYREFKENVMGKVDTLETQRNWAASGIVALVAALGLFGLWKGNGKIRSKFGRGNGELGSEELKSRAMVKIDSLLQRVQPARGSGRLSSDEEKELKTSISKAVKAYESEDYKKSLKHVEKTEEHINYEDFELEKHTN